MGQGREADRMPECWERGGSPGVGSFDLEDMYIGRGVGSLEV